MPKPLYTLKATTTPLPRAQAAAEGAPEKPAGVARPKDPNVRAENEDDDGYDPYSDRRETTPLFERDPWA